MSEPTRSPNEGFSKAKGALGGSAKQATLIFMALCSLYPLYFVLVNAFKTKVDYVGNKIGLPTHWVIDSFTRVLHTPNFARWFGNTILVTLGSVFVSLLIGAMAAFALSRMRFRGRNFILNAIIVLMVIPAIVMIIPMFVLMVRLALANTYTSVIIVYTGLLLPFTIYMLYGFFGTIPTAITDAAAIDGCSRLQEFVYIMLPLSLPALVTLLLVNALWVWNELLVSLILLQREELKTIMVGLTLFRGRFSVDVPVIMAGLVIGTIPILLLYIVGQRAFVRGLVAGSTKGE